MPYDYRLEDLMEPFCDVHWISQIVSDREPVSRAVPLVLYSYLPLLYKPYELTCTAFLFAMHGPQVPMLITVPIDTRDGRPPDIDDLSTDYWIRPTESDHTVYDLAATRKYFDRYPETNLPLPFPCTIYFECQSNRQGINRTLRQMGLSKDWKGNYIVVKNVHEEECSSMSSQDEDAVVELVRQYVVHAPSLSCASQSCVPE